MNDAMARGDLGHPVIVVPGLGGSDDDHWQSWLERKISKSGRLSGVDWERPELSLWLDRLHSALRAKPDSILIAHSLGCALVAHAASLYPKLPASAALLVAPADVDASPIIPQTLRSFAGVPSSKLPFPSVVVASANDPYMSSKRAAHFASAWGARLIELGACGHINVASGFGPWPEGLQILREFARDIGSHKPLATSLHINETERA